MDFEKGGRVFKMNISVERIDHLIPSAYLLAAFTLVRDLGHRVRDSSRGVTVRPL